jgi:hypothetical protein
VTNVYNNVYVNKTVNVTNITYQNQNVNNAVTATSQASFTSAQPVAKNMMRIFAKEVTAAPVAPTGPAVVPQQRSVLGAGAQASVKPPAAVISRTVVAKVAPPPPLVPFAKQQDAIQANGGRPISAGQARQMQPEVARPNVHIAPPAKPATPQNANATPNRPTQPAQQNQPNPSAQQNANRPPQQGNNANRPVTTNDNIQNGRGNPENPNRFNNRPPSARPSTPPPNPQLEQKHQQEAENLRQQQDRERQKIEQQQVQEQQRAQQQNNERKQQDLQQSQQRQLEQLEQKHGQEQQKLQQKQQREEQKARPENKPSENKPPKNDRPPR